jgi:hypothetical protein
MPNGATMQLDPFIAKLVNAGEPLTAQAWNDLVTAIDNAHKFLLATTNVVKVRITNAGVDPTTVRVTASRSDAPPVEAIRPFGGDTFHTLAELELGAYTIRASAPGFADATAALNVTGAPIPEVTIALTSTNPIMPDVFGMSLTQALAALRTAGATVNRVLDFSGKDVPPSSPSPEAARAPVLVQHPQPGVPVTSGVGLVVAVETTMAGAIVMPSLAGLTETEARRAIEQAGLVVGRINILES